MKIAKPKITYTEEKTFIEAYEQRDFTNGLFKENSPNQIVLSDLYIDSCIFDKIDFNNITLDVDIYDVIFEGCNLSNLCFDSKMLSRVVFKNCKLVGTTFINAHLKDIFFDNSVVKLCNFANAKLENVSFVDSDLSDSFFLESEVKQIAFDRVNLTKTEFVKVNLNNVDLSTCDIYGTLFDMKSLKGIIVDSLQCSSLVGMLGVKIKD